MKYLATVDGHDVPVEIQAGSRPGLFLAIMAGKTYEVDLRETARGWQWSLIVDGRSYQLAASEGAVQLDRDDYAVEIERDLGVARARAGGAAGGPARLRAPIPGLVVAINIAVGDEVHEGQALVILEAMKMQMELKSPRAGHVLEINVQLRQEAGQGQVLAIIAD